MQAHELYNPFAWFFAGVANIMLGLPSILALFAWLERRTAWRTLIALSLFALLFESQAILTGFPYSHFHYTALSGWLLFGLVPWTLPFSWVPLLLGSATVSYRLVSGRVSRIVVIAILLTAIDLAFDPLATRLGLWVWASPGGFYGVPWQNFFGWFISGLLGGALFAWLTRTATTLPSWRLTSSVQVFLLISGVVQIGLGMWLPAGLCLALLLLFWQVRSRVR